MPFKLLNAISRPISTRLSNKLDRWHSSKRLERLSSPNSAIADRFPLLASLSPTPPRYAVKLDPATSPRRDGQSDAPRGQPELGSDFQSPSNTYQQGPTADGMSLFFPLPSQEYTAIKNDSSSPVPMAQPDNDQAHHESSEDDVPLMARHQLRNAVDKRDDGTTPRERRPLRDTGRNKDRESGGYARDRPMLRQPTKTSPKTASKHKKPGPRAWATKPIMKNDMEAKKEVIREIEGFWGRGFIRAYIPKCHRPLVKRGNGSKRTGYREHETDPKNWLPSVLKAILMIAKLTDDKQWLKKAMNEVVRYRIKHTGNRKPQLVTTDFDVIEDMLVKEWSVDYSFEIRYKHLLVNRKEEEEDEENIDHILEATPDTDDSNADDGEGGDQESSDDDDDDKDGDQERDGISNKYQQSSGYTKTTHYLPPALPRHHSKQPKMRKKTPTKQGQLKRPGPGIQPGMYSPGAHMPGYGPPMDPWGRPMPGYGGPDAYNNGYGGYGSGCGGGFGGYGGYGVAPQYGQDVRQGAQQPHARGMPQYAPPHHTMTPAPSISNSNYSQYRNPEHRGLKRSRVSPFGQNQRARDGYDHFPGYEMQGYANPYHGARTKIKRESPVDERRSFDDDLDDRSNDLGAQVDDDDTKTAADAEVEAMEIELKLAKLKAARLREQQRMKK